MASPIVWCDIPVIDLDRAIRFYSLVLGKTIARHDYPGMAIGILPHAGSEVGACLFLSETAQPGGHGPLIYLNTNGRLDEVLAQVEALGGQILQEKHPLGPHAHRAIIRDSEGNRVALHSA